MPRKTLVDDVAASFASFLLGGVCANVVYLFVAGVAVVPFVVDGARFAPFLLMASPQILPRVAANAASGLVATMMEERLFPRAIHPWRSYHDQSGLEWRRTSLAHCPPNLRRALASVRNGGAASRQDCTHGRDC